MLQKFAPNFFILKQYVNRIRLEDILCTTIVNEKQLISELPHTHIRSNNVERDASIDTLSDIQGELNVTRYRKDHLSNNVSKPF